MLVLMDPPAFSRTLSSTTRPRQSNFLLQWSTTPNEHCMKFHGRPRDGLKFLTRDSFPEWNKSAALPSMSFTTDNAFQSPLAKGILTIYGVEEVTLAEEFLTVRRAIPAPPTSITGEEELLEVEEEPKEAQESMNLPQSETVKTGVVEEDPSEVEEVRDWNELVDLVCAAISDHFVSGKVALTLDAPHPYNDTLPQEGDSEMILCIKELISETVRPEVKRDGGDIRFIKFDDTTGIVWIELLGACKTCGSSETTLKNLIERTLQHWIPEVNGVAEYIDPSKEKVRRRRVKLKSSNDQEAVPFFKTAV